MSKQSNIERDIGYLRGRYFHLRSASYLSRVYGFEGPDIEHVDVQVSTLGPYDEKDPYNGHNLSRVEDKLTRLPEGGSARFQIEGLDREFSAKAKLTGRVPRLKIRRNAVLARVDPDQLKAVEWHNENRDDFSEDWKRGWQAHVKAVNTALVVNELVELDADSIQDLKLAWINQHPTRRGDLRLVPKPELPF